MLKAYDILARNGLLSRRQGDGTFVNDAPPTLKKSERRRQIAAILGHASAQAVHFDIAAEELHDLLDAEINRLRKGGTTDEQHT